MFRAAVSLALALALLSGAAHAGKYNKKLSIGDPAPTFKNLPGTDGKNHSLDDFKTKDVVVISITCNHCPVAMDYESRTIELTKKYALGAESKVAVIAISVSKEDEDRLDKMQERAREKGFNFPYLYDETQAIGRALGATVTPDIFILDRERKIAYMGALDDSISARGVKEKYVEAAIDALLAGKKVPVSETRSRGCSLTYEKKK